MVWRMILNILFPAGIPRTISKLIPKNLGEESIP